MTRVSLFPHTTRQTPERIPGRTLKPATDAGCGHRGGRTMGISAFERYVRFLGASGGAALLVAAILVLAPAVARSQDTPPPEPAASPTPTPTPSEEATPEGTNIGFGGQGPG